MNDEDDKVGLRERFEALRAYQQQILQESAPIREEQEALLQEREQLDKKIRTLTTKIHAIEKPKLHDVGMEIAAIARRLGARSVGMRRR